MGHSDITGQCTRSAHIKTTGTHVSGSAIRPRIEASCGLHSPANTSKMAMAKVAPVSTMSRRNSRFWLLSRSMLM